MFVNMVLFLFKLVAGFVGRSGAMIADAVHSASDFVTDVVVLAFVRISAKPRDDDHKWGHGKYETLASLLIGVALFAVGVDILMDTVVVSGSVVVAGAVVVSGALEDSGAFVAGVVVAGVSVQEASARQAKTATSARARIRFVILSFLQ